MQRILIVEDDEKLRNEVEIFKRNKIVSREEIMDYLWESESFIDE